MIAKRRLLPKLVEPPYDFKDVPSAKRDLEGSVVIRITERKQWLGMLSEMLLLCNEAARRSARRSASRLRFDSTLRKTADASTNTSTAVCMSKYRRRCMCLSSAQSHVLV